MKVFVYDAEIGDSIQNACKKIAEIAENPKYDKIKMNFNGIKIIAGSGETAEDLLKQFDRKIKASKKAYRMSKKYKKLKREERIELKALKSEADLLLRKFKFLDKKDYEKVLEWAERFQEYSDRRKLKLNKYQVLIELKKHGYKANENTGKDFDGENKENFARYMIGQVVSMLETHRAIHPIISKWHKEWKDKFIA